MSELPETEPQELKKDAETPVSPAPEKKEEPSQEKPQPEKKKGRAAGILFDTLLVLILLGALGAGAWYTKQQLDVYHVPTPLELAQAEHLELCKQHQQLQDAAYKADEQLHMRERITNLDLQLSECSRKIQEIKQNINIENERVLAIQREIIQEDKTSRSVAKSLLIGLPIGNASTTNGRVYPDAIIHRIESGRITLRTPNGQVRFPLSQLVKENLPDMARYAFGLDDMVDTSDFELPSGKKAGKRRQGKLISPRKPSTQVQEPSYEPESKGPVVNTQAPQQGAINVQPELIPDEQGTWEAPQGELPIAE